MTGRLPLLPTSVVGSHALRDWLVLGREAQAAGRLGPIGRRELIEAATRIALLDQLAAGIDVAASGFWATPRPAAVGKLRAMVAGTRIVRQELAAGPGLGG